MSDMEEDQDKVFKVAEEQLDFIIERLSKKKRVCCWLVGWVGWCAAVNPLAGWLGLFNVGYMLMMWLVLRQSYTLDRLLFHFKNARRLLSDIQRTPKMEARHWMVEQYVTAICCATGKKYEQLAEIQEQNDEGESWKE